MNRCIDRLLLARLQHGYAATHTIDYLLEQAEEAGDLLAKPMFGEFGIYLDGRMIGSVCDDRLFIKPTAGGRAMASEATEVAPYPGAKPQMLIDGDRWEDADWLCALLRATATEVSVPKPRRRKPT